MLFSICLLAGEAGAQEVKMHRSQAGELDGSGWMLAASTEGRFSVRLPLKFNDFTTVEADPRAPGERTYTVGSRSSESIALSATRIVYRKGAASAREYFARFEAGRGLGVPPESITPRKVGELRAVDLVLRRSTNVAYQRVVLLDADLLLLIVESPPGHEATVQRLAPIFFESLQVDAR